MTQEYAERSFLLADKGLHDRDVTRAVRQYAKGLFAEIAVRIVAFALDLLLILFVMIVLNDHVFGFIGANEKTITAIWFVVLIAYFTACWTSPLRATPAQFLFRMRVQAVSGMRLTVRDAAIRSVALVAQWALALFLLRQSFVAPDVWIMGVAVALLLYLPSVTARRQGLHDFLARSVVVNKRSLRSDEDVRHMRDFLADRQVATLRSSRPSIVKMVIDAVVLAAPLFVIAMMIGVSHQKNMYARMAYAMGEAREMQFQVATWREATGDWPTTEAELGRPLRHDYPAGGYFELEDGGVISIQFEIRPELKDGSILLEPQVENGKVRWNCRAVGDIERQYLPGNCRD